MTDRYFLEVDAKPPIKSDKTFSFDGARTDLLSGHYKLARKKAMTKEKIQQINESYIKWCEALFCGFNIVVTGYQSKFALLETFRCEYLESGKIPNYKSGKQRENKSSKFLKIQTIILHGMEPIKMAVFEHGIFGIKENRKATNDDYKRYIREVESDDRHCVFFIHSFELFYKSCEDILDVILKLYSMNQERIHLVLSSDCVNGAKKLNPIQMRARLLYFEAPYTESFFDEKSQVLSQLDIDEKGGNITVHRLFQERADLQSMKDVYQALGPTQKIMAYIIENYVQKCELIQQRPLDNGTKDTKRIRYGAAEDTVVDSTLTTKTNENTRSGRRKTQVQNKPVSTDLDFHDLLKYCESNFIVRRGAALEQHLGELKDHNIIKSSDDVGGKIQCIVNLSTCRSFLEYLKSESAD